MGQTINARLAKVNSSHQNEEKLENQWKHHETNFGTFGHDPPLDRLLCCLPFGELGKALLTGPHRSVDDLQEELSSKHNAAHMGAYDLPAPFLGRWWGFGVPLCRRRVHPTSSQPPKHSYQLRP